MIELKIVTRIRERLAAWRKADYPGASRTTLELLAYWSREGRKQPLFFAQHEAAETVSFLVEARAEFRQGLEVPRDEPSDDKKAEGYVGFLRYACKMATGSGKSTVMGMLAASSISAWIFPRHRIILGALAPMRIDRFRGSSVTLDLLTRLNRDWSRFRSWPFEIPRVHPLPGISTFGNGYNRS